IDNPFLAAECVLSGLTVSTQTYVDIVIHFTYYWGELEIASHQPNAGMPSEPILNSYSSQSAIELIVALLNRNEQLGKYIVENGYCSFNSKEKSLEITGQIAYNFVYALW